MRPFVRVVVATVCAGAMAIVLEPRATSQGAEQPPVAALESTSGLEAGATLINALNEGLPYVPGELLVRFKPGVDLGQSQSALRVLRTPIAENNGEWIGEVLHLRGLDIDDPV